MFQRGCKPSLACHREQAMQAATVYRNHSPINEAHPSCGPPAGFPKGLGLNKTARVASSFRMKHHTERIPSGIKSSCAAALRTLLDERLSDLAGRDLATGRDSIGNVVPSIVTSADGFR